MLTLITGTPGAGKSLYTVWEIGRKVPGSKVPDGKGGQIERRLHSNIKNLIIPHDHITAEDLNCWHKWAKPGDVIIFDEVQEVWRPRGKVSEVPECIAKLETHRHMGVDIVLITQNPMLVDSNIRRLVNQHIHLRRVTKASAYRYEWDSCMDAPTSKYSAAMHSGFWFHPKKAYELYKSAELHTKPTVRVPKVAVLGIAAILAGAYLGPTFYSRLQERLNPAKVAQQPAPQFPQITKPTAAPGTPSGLPPAPGAVPPAPVVAQAPQHLGCIASPTRCDCFADDGRKVVVPEAVCREGSHKVGFVLAGYGASPHGGGSSRLGPLAPGSGADRVSPSPVTPASAPSGAIPASSPAM